MLVSFKLVDIFTEKDHTFFFVMLVLDVIMKVDLSAQLLVLGVCYKGLYHLSQLIPLTTI